MQNLTDDITRLMAEVVAKPWDWKTCSIMADALEEQGLDAKIYRLRVEVLRKGRGHQDAPKSKVVKFIKKHLKNKKRKASFLLADFVIPEGTEWGGGTRNYYHVVDLEVGNATTMSWHKVPGYNPMSMNPVGNDQEIILGDKRIVVQEGIFCGKETELVIYVHPTDVHLLF